MLGLSNFPCYLRPVPHSPQLIFRHDHQDSRGCIVLLPQKAPLPAMAAPIARRGPQASEAYVPLLGAAHKNKPLPEGFLEHLQQLRADPPWTIPSDQEAYEALRTVAAKVDWDAHAQKTQNPMYPDGYVSAELQEKAIALLPWHVQMAVHSWATKLLEFDIDIKPRILRFRRKPQE